MASDKGKADFSNVQAAVRSTAPAPTSKADFSNVKSAVTSTAATVETPAPRTYTVKKGDSLSKIAKSELGAASKWKAIWELNKDQIANPDLIRPGQVLKLP